jgi:dienelactone hydrolase
MFVPVMHARNGACRSRSRARAASAVGIVVAIAVSSSRHGVSHPTPTWMSWTAIGAAIAAVLYVIVQRAMRPDEPSAQAVAEPSDEQHTWKLVIVGLAAALLALALFLGLSPRIANSQEAPLQSAFVITRGADTIVVERITRGRSSLTADLTMVGMARMIFTAELASGPSVPGMTFKAWGAGASIDTPPLQSGTQSFSADSAFITVQTQGGERKLSRAVSRNPLPLMNNDFTMIELAIARARATGAAKATVPMFSMGGGVQLDCSIEFVGADTAVFRVAGQENRFGLTPDGRISGGLVIGQPILITRVDGAAAAKISIGRPDYGAPAGAPYRAEEVTVKTPMGHVLTGTLTIPNDAKGKVPAVVTITGSGQEDRDEYISLVPGYRIFRQVADTLGRRGIAVLRMDDRAINGSGGDVQKATSADFADDIRAGVAYLRGRSEIDGARIALVGHSEGGMIAPLVASTDAKIKAIVLMAGPAYTGERIIEFQLKNGVMGAPSIPATSKDSALKAVRAQFDSTSGKIPWMQYFLTYDPVPTARKVKQPVFIMQGGTDQQVTPDQAPVLEQAFKDGGNKDVTLKVFKDHNHLFLLDPSGFPGGYTKLTNGKIDGDVMGSLADWLVARLKP